MEHITITKSKQQIVWKQMFCLSKAQGGKVNKPEQLHAENNQNPFSKNNKTH
jgi:hypothetical protein